MGPNFFTNLGGASLDRVELVMAPKEAFDAEWSDDEVENIRGFRKVQEVLDYLRKRGKGGK